MADSMICAAKIVIAPRETVIAAVGQNGQGHEGPLKRKTSVIRQTLMIGVDGRLPSSRDGDEPANARHDPRE